MFGTFTPDLERLADWLIGHQVDTVAMESTEVYWIPVYEVLEARGLKVYLVNGRHVKHVPGRKSDVQDCQWLQKLHALGLLGIGLNLAQIILSEIGTDMSKWATEKQATAWLGLAPRNDISGGKVLRSHTLPSQNRAGQAFRQAATSVARSPNAFGAYYRRNRAPGGPLFAQIATAHKFARTVYHLLKYRVPYVDIGAEEFVRKQRERNVNALRKRAAKLGFALVDAEPVPGIAWNPLKPESEYLIL
jgi:transposase